MPSRFRWLLLLVPGLLLFYTLGGMPPEAEAARCKNCPPDAGTDGGTRDGGTGSDGGIPDGGTGSDGGTLDGGTGSDGGIPDGGTSTDGGTASSCLAGPLLTSLGKNHLLVGGKMAKEVLTQAPFDVRYIYLAGGLCGGAAPCASCVSCTSGGQSCASSNPGGCGWWGCWQYDQDPPGQYLRDFLRDAASVGQIPMITYYEILHTSGAAEGAREVAKAQDVALMQRYFNDWRFTLKQIGSTTAFLHLEPDFWGYAQQVNPNPHLVAAAVASANPTDCASMENSIAGMGRCMLAMVRKYAPGARVGLHASAWGTKVDVLSNKSTTLDVEAEARKLADFLLECGAASSDFVVVETSDRDAQWYEVTTQTNRWWDATNVTLPNFRQAFRWAKALSERLGLPNLWWQMPVGNLSLPGLTQQWKDNRLDYFFDHPGEVTAAHGLGMVFGAGEEAQTNPSTDVGHFVQRTKSYFSSGGQATCSSGTP